MYAWAEIHAPVSLPCHSRCALVTMRVPVTYTVPYYAVGLLLIWISALSNLIRMAWSSDWNYVRIHRADTRWTDTTHETVQLSRSDRVGSGSDTAAFLKGSWVTCCPGIYVSAPWKSSGRNALVRASSIEWYATPTPGFTCYTKTHSFWRELCMTV